MKKSIYIAVGCLALLLIQYVLFYPFLPERLISHFNAAGTPDGWMEKDQFLKFFGAVYVLNLSITLLILPIILWKTPLERLNLPHKQYWLAPERSESTRRFLYNINTAFGALTALFLNGVLFFVLNRNAQMLTSFIDGSVLLYTTVGFLGVILFLVIALLVHFYSLPVKKLKA